MFVDTLFILLISLIVTVIFLTCVTAYFLPALIAFLRNHPHKIAILVLNLLTGATGIGWIVSFIWAFVDNPVLKLKEAPTVAQEIKDLAQLKDEGIITEEEFNNRKNKLLNS